MILSNAHGFFFLLIIVFCCFVFLFLVDLYAGWWLADHRVSNYRWRATLGWGQVCRESSSRSNGNAQSSGEWCKYSSCIVSLLLVKMSSFTIGCLINFGFHCLIHDRWNKCHNWPHLRNVCWNIIELVLISYPILWRHCKKSKFSFSSFSNHLVIPTVKKEFFFFVNALAWYCRNIEI